MIKISQKTTLLAAVFISALCHAEEPKNILLLAGKPSHGPGQHEHNAGALLFSKCLDASGLPVKSTVILNGAWPSPEQLAAADTVLIYCDGGPDHLLLVDDRMQQLSKEMKRGCGLVCLHYGVEIPKDNGGADLLGWMGGYFETNWSVNPHWKADFKSFPAHPVSNGLKPYALQDEWYYHMRFSDKGKLSHILSATAPVSTTKRPDGEHSGNPHVRKAVAEGLPQTVAWAFERPDGGRGFGFTGGHFHKNWGEENQRKVVLNAILWTAKVEVPAEGVASKVTPGDLEANQDPKGDVKPKPQAKEQASTDHGDCKQCAFSAAAF
jgi:trehalose utilization protein